MGDLKLAEFKNASAIIEFIKIIDLAFDLLNVRNPYGKYSKEPMRPNNEVAMIYIYIYEILYIFNYIF